MDLELAQITGRQSDILDKAIKEKRELTREEERKYDQLEFQAQQLLNQPINQPVERPIPENRGGIKKMETTAKTTEFRQYLADGEFRTLQVDKDVSGGFATVDTDTYKKIIHDLDNEVFIRKLARRFTFKAQTVGIPVMDSDVSSAQWTGEISEASLDTQMDFERRSLLPTRLVKAIKVSRHLLDIGVDNFSDFVIQRLTNMIAVTEENGFLTGHGAGQPLGIFTTSPYGISASRDVSTGNSTTEIKADNLIEVMYNLKGQYLRSPACRWIFHRNAIKMIRKLKTGDGQYIWEPGIGTDRPATILGIPYLLSEYCPNTFTTGLRVGCIGDLSYYGIAENSTLRIQVLLEKYALENCNGYIVQRFVDGMPLLENAFSMVTLA